jgi:homogentisate 1,2-dioxygenase
MVDTFRPLHLGPAARQSEDPEYPWTWGRGEQARETGGAG